MGLAGFGCAAGPMSPVSLLLRKITWGERPGSCSASFVPVFTYNNFKKIRVYGSTARSPNIA